MPLAPALSCPHAHGEASGTRSRRPGTRGQGSHDVPASSFWTLLPLHKGRGSQSGADSPGCNLRPPPCWGPAEVLSGQKVGEPRAGFTVGVETRGPSCQAVVSYAQSSPGSLPHQPHSLGTRCGHSAPLSLTLAQEGWLRPGQHCRKGTGRSHARGPSQAPRLPDQQRRPRRKQGPLVPELAVPRVPRSVRLHPPAAFRACQGTTACPWDWGPTVDIHQVSGHGPRHWLGL